MKYPKFFVLFLTFVVAYFLFAGRSALSTQLQNRGIISILLAGIMYSYGFTAAPSTALFLILAKTENIWLAGFLGGFGSLLGDLIIFKTIKEIFADEVDLLAKEKFVISLQKMIPKSIKKFIVPVIGGIFIASPLPDEIGVSLMAMQRSMKTWIFLFLSYSLNTAGIFVILLIGRSL
jgi:hypothetical protein